MPEDIAQVLDLAPAPSGIKVTLGKVSRGKRGLVLEQEKVIGDQRIKIPGICGTSGEWSTIEDGFSLIQKSHQAVISERLLMGETQDDLRDRVD